MASNNQDKQSKLDITFGKKTLSRTGKSERGFAAMDPARQRAIASDGGKAAHLSGNAHEFNSEEAREAGRKGGRSGRR